MAISQSNRSMTVSSPLDDDALILMSVSWKERLGQPFVGSLQMGSEQGDIDAMDLLGQPMSVQIGSGVVQAAYLNGYVTEFEQSGYVGGLFGYRVRLKPWIGMLSHVGGSRIFQNQTVVEIIKEIVDQRGFTAELDDQLTQTYRTRAYCVQYNESDLQFISRLLEEEGIYYFFKYDEDQHTLVLCDDVGAHETVTGLDAVIYRDNEPMTGEICASKWSNRRQFSTASVVLKDYDFQKPRAEMTVRQNASDTASEWQWYKYPGRYFDTEDGEHYARVHMEAASAKEKATTFHMTAPGIQAGNLVVIHSHPNSAMNQQYLVTESELNATLPTGVAGGENTSDLNVSIKHSVQPSSSPFRSPQSTPRRLMPGPQIATVVGPDGEEIWTDQYGRIKIQFAWDIEGVSDDASSCWIRVTQPWTGKGWGAASIPRVGEEVIVEFLDGDVDRPIVTGRVYNADRMPPEELASGQAKTVFRTRSTKEGDVDCFHELTFDDTKDAEKIYLHSERDFERVVENDDSLIVGFDKQDSGDQTIEIYNDQNLTIGVGSGSGSQTVEIGQDRTTTIDGGDDTLVISSGDRATTLDSGDDTLTISSGDRTVNAESGSITLEAGTSITLKCGSSQIEITPSGITIKSSTVDIKGDTQLNAQAAEVAVKADASLKLSGGASASIDGGGMTTIKGAMVQIN